MLGGIGAATVLGASLRPTASATATRPLQRALVGCTRYRVLEIYLAGGLSHRETLWIESPDANLRWRDLSGIDSSSWNLAVAPPMVSDMAAWTTPFVGGVRFGPAASAIEGHPVLQRTRLVATRHDLEPHIAAGALTLGGLPIGRTRNAGLGAVIQRRYGSASDPVSFVIAPRAERTYTSFMANPGVHGSAHRPVVIRLETSLQADLLRAHQPAAHLPEIDALHSFYRDRHDTRMIYPGGGPARSEGYEAYAAAMARLMRAPALSARLAAGPSLTNLPSLPGSESSVGRAIQIGSYLLSTGARYAGVVDEGVVEIYDTHYDNYGDLRRHALAHNGNLFHVLLAIRNEVDAGVLNLDETMVIVRSEFGRYWSGQPNPNGTNHWPAGYCTLLIGGPIEAPGLAGSLQDAGDDAADDLVAIGGPSGKGFSPTDLRAATLLAAGIDPFDPDCLWVNETTWQAPGDPPLDPAIARQGIATDVLGVGPTALQTLCPNDVDPADAMENA